MDNALLSRRALACGLGLAAALPAFPALGRGLTRPLRTDPDPEDPTRVLDAARRLTVQVEVNGRGPYAFMVDTGANASVISSEVAAALGLQRGAPAILHGVAGAERVDTVSIAELTVGRRARRGMTLSVLPERFLGAHGVLGLDWLGVQGLTLDFARQKMTVGPSAPRTDARSVSVPVFSRPSGLHLIEAQVAGVQTLAFLDTGSTMTIGNAALLRQATRRKGMVRDWADVQVVSVTGAALPGRLAALNQIQLGNVMLRTVPVVFGPVHTFDYWGLADRPAILIGVDVLKNFDAVAFDFSRGRVHFRLPSASAAREAAAS